MHISSRGDDTIPEINRGIEKQLLITPLRILNSGRMGYSFSKNAGEGDI